MTRCRRWIDRVMVLLLLTALLSGAAGGEAVRNTEDSVGEITVGEITVGEITVGEWKVVPLQGAQADAPDALRVVGYTGQSARVQIPDSLEITVDGRTFVLCVAEVGEKAFAGNGYIKEAVLGDGVRVIGAGAFEGCVMLEKAVIPPSVQQVDARAFGENRSVWIHAAYGSAGERFAREQGLSCVFLREHNEEYVYLRTPQGIEILSYIGRSAVLEMPDALDGMPITVIGEGAFRQARALRSVTLGKHVVRVEDEAFMGLRNLEQVTTGEGLIYLGRRAFARCTALREICLPSGFEHMEADAFEGGGRLKVISEADSPAFALARAQGLETVDIWTQYDAFVYEKRGGELALCGYVMDERTVRLPAEYAHRAVTAVSTGAFGAGEWTIIVPEGYTALECGAFEGCTKLDITLPRSLTQIDEASFSGCGQVTIRGYVGTQAEEYARRTGCRFIVRHDW